MKVPKVPRLPHTSRLRCRKCHACHVEDSRRPWVHRRRRASADIYEGTESATPATHIAPTVLKVSRLPHRRQCHACHVQDSRRPWVHRRRQASADIYEGTERATPATQIEPEAPKVSRLPRRRQSASMGPPSSPSFRGHL